MKINKFYFFNKNNKMRIIYNISKKKKLNFILLKNKKIKVKSKKKCKNYFQIKYNNLINIK